MPPAIIQVIAVAALLLALSVDGEEKRVVLSLERASHDGVGMSQLRHRDRVRHARLLQQQPSASASASSVVDFSVQGTYDPYLVG
ncbi:hypothetical protein SASPL_104685 [Salvia splendens]|uniref:Secreted protein n=1 Tax=Salvia splendens TaxID=180675 RepID=A0A8X9A9A7_SALSN|nr:hypothetical protein SASPL_104685 [Salvia splendens]